MVYYLVGCQTEADRENFARYVASCLDGERLRGNLLAAHGQTTKASVFPIGIAAKEFAELAETESVKGPLLPVQDDEMKTIIGVDRLDYTKGIPERLRAIEALLAIYPAHHRRGRLIPKCSPPPEARPRLHEVPVEV